MCSKVWAVGEALKVARDLEGGPSNVLGIVCRDERAQQLVQLAAVSHLDNEIVVPRLVHLDPAADAHASLAALAYRLHRRRQRPRLRHVARVGVAAVDLNGGGGSPVGGARRRRPPFEAQAHPTIREGSPRLRQRLSVH